MSKMKQQYRPVMKDSFVLIKYKCHAYTLVELPFIKNVELFGVPINYIATLSLN